MSAFTVEAGGRSPTTAADLTTESRYRSKEEFVTATFGRMTEAFQEPADLKLVRLRDAGDDARLGVADRVR